MEFWWYKRDEESNKTRPNSNPRLVKIHSVLQPAAPQGRLSLKGWVCNRVRGPLLLRRCDCMIVPVGCKLGRTDSSWGGCSWCRDGESCCNGLKIMPSWKNYVFIALMNLGCASLKLRLNSLFLPPKGEKNTWAPQECIMKPNCT